MIPNLSKDMIDLMQQLRKRLRSEFNAELKLSQSNIIEVILQLVERSKDQRTQLLFADLEDMMGVELRNKPALPENSESASNGSHGVYRGQPIAAPLTSTDKANTSHIKTRIYRGQVVA
jgi:hypothetical protein